MRKQTRFLIPVLMLVPLAALVRNEQPVAAQPRATTRKELPNVLLLVDTSGSMERMALPPLPNAKDAPLPGEHEAYQTTHIGEATNPPALPLPTACVPGVASIPNRWGSLVQSLTGTFQPGYSCAAVSRARTAPTFTTLYGTGATDVDYVLPYHRPLTGGIAKPCGLMPELAPAGTKVEAREHLVPQIANTRGTGAPCSFAQANDGQLDIAVDLVRFGLMTFDSVTSNKTTKEGGYSYFLGGAAKANPAGCTDAPRDFEVGARTDEETPGGPKVPEWEGPLVRFPAADASASELKQQNERIQSVLAALRPSGATPIDGMMSDASDYLLKDPAGPDKDQFVKGTCRDQYIVLLTDGAPNLDMRPECQGSSGVCPYNNRAAQTAGNLFNNGGPSALNNNARNGIKTYVIGFAVSGAKPGAYPGGALSCGAWFNAATPNPATVARDFSDACRALTPPMSDYGAPAAACCALNEIAINGSGAPANYAENQQELSAAFAKILADVASDASTRSTPTYSSANGTNTGTATFSASFAPSPLQAWSGNVIRDRLVCVGGVRTEVAPDPSVGDDLAAALSSQNATVGRNVLLVSPTVPSNAAVAEGRQSLRPYQDAIPADFIASVATEELVTNPLASIIGAGASRAFGLALGVGPTTCPKSIFADGNVNKTIPALSGDDCRRSVLGFALAAPPAAMAMPFDLGYNFSSMRCPKGMVGCNPLGAIYRANPTFVPPPSATLRDETYRAFARPFPNGFGDRPSVLYVATSDGQLHALDALNEQTLTAAPRELWTFIPPAVAIELKSNLPRGSRQILDGTPVARDVVFDRSLASVSATTIASGPIDLKKDGWHTVLAAAMGSSTRGFYALDVTDPSLVSPPVKPASAGTLRNFVAGLGSATSRNPGPHFLWQVTDLPKLAGESADLDVHVDAENKQRVSMFGKSGVTPVITTLFFDPSGGGLPREIAVAILPGGYENTAIAGATCPRQDAAQNMAASPYLARTLVRKWTTGACNSGVIGRSLTIVRLDNGQIIRAFGRNTLTSGYDLPKVLRDANLVTDTPLDSPMVGVPIAYPSGAGAITQKVFVTDADGTVWRFDLTSRRPVDWTGRLFLDTQNKAVNSSSDVIAAVEGEPIAVSPVVALTTAGDIMLGIATGDQEQLPRNGPAQLVYSVSERYGASINPIAEVNWYQKFTDAERVTGTMAIFDSIMYYATYKPSSTASVCAEGRASIYGVDYLAPETPKVSAGGVPRTFLTVNALYGDLTADKPGRLNAGKFPIPGVSIRSLQACVNDTFEAYATNSNSAASASQAGEFGLVFGAPVAAGGSKSVGSKVNKLPLPAISKATRVDSWAAVTE